MRTEPHQQPQTRLLLNTWREASGGDTAEAIRRLDAMFACDGHALNWSGLGLTSLPECIGQFTRIRQLDLADNALTALPASIGQLSGITVLEAQKNQITSLPDSITTLRNLHRLNLEGNQLTGLPRQMPRLAALRELRLCDNRLTSCDVDFSQMTGLLELHIAQNPLSLRDAALGNLAPTTLVHAQGNLPDSAAPAQRPSTTNVYHTSELAQALASGATGADGDPLSARTPARRIQLLLEAASDLTSKIDTDTQRIWLGNRSLTRKDCLLMALESALQHHQNLLPVISHHLIHDLPEDTAHFGVLGSTLKREKINDWAQSRDLPAQAMVDDVALNVGNRMHTTDGQNVHADVVLIAGARLLDRVRQRVPVPLSVASTRTAIATHLRTTNAPAAALRGLDLVMNRTDLLGNFDASAATAMALMWTYITQTEEQPLRNNLLDAMQSRLVEITTSICAMGTIQRVIDIPNGVDFSLTGAISTEQLRGEMQQLAGQVNDEFEGLHGGVPVDDSPARAFDFPVEALTGNLAKAPTDFAGGERLLIRAIESGTGIYEFVSRRAHFRPSESASKPIIATLFNTPDVLNGQLQLAGRYQVASLERINQSATPENKDHLCAQMTVRETHSQQQHLIPLTQVGLQFTDQILRSAALERANVLLEQHLERIADPAHDGYLPILVSTTGTGRSVLLRGYREIRQGMRDGVIRDATQLDNALELLVKHSLTTRGKTGAFSPEQIAEMKTPLLRELAPLNAAGQAQRMQQREIEASDIKRALFKQKAHLELVLLRGIDATLVAAETERIFPAGMVI